jgi:hypothetical protein
MIQGVDAELVWTQGNEIMTTRMLIVAAAAFLAASAPSYATTINGSYTASATGPYAPDINYSPYQGATYTFMASPFTQTLTVGTPTTPTAFFAVVPLNYSSSVGTVGGAVSVALTLTDASGAAVTSFSYTTGGDAVTLSNGVLNLTANYDLFYAGYGGNSTPTDCIVWNASSCTPSDNTGVNITTPLGETVTATFGDGEVLAVSLYNWTDWNMEPNISFNLVSGPTSAIPEPASIAIFGAALIGLGVIRRRSRGDWSWGAVSPSI